jgi:hypothetical protein
MAARSRSDPRRVRARRPRDLTLAKLQSALTNGSKLFLGDADETGPWCRRLRDLRFAYEADLGGAGNLSEGQRTIMHRLAMLALQCEMLETKFAKNDGQASPTQLALYQRTANSMRRLIESLNIHRGRIARDITDDVTDKNHDILERVLAKVEEGATP